MSLSQPGTESQGVSLNSAVPWSMPPPWVRAWRRAWLGSDLTAGLVVAVMLVPQSLAYAMLAGLPPQAGLLASLLPLLAYALFGSSMVQSVGPMAITSLMTATSLAALRARGHGTLCFYGPPGTGKTALAEHLARTLERPLMLRRASDLVSKFVGETEQQMAAMFAEAEAEQAVRQLSLSDELTGLYNRRGFLLLAERELEAARRRKGRGIIGRAAAHQQDQAGGRQCGHGSAHRVH